MQLTFDEEDIVTVLNPEWLARFVELVQELREKRVSTDSNILAAAASEDDLNKRLYELRAYIHRLTEMETADKKLAIKAAFLVRQRFLLAVVRETEMRFPVGITRYLLEIRQQIRRRFTVLQDIPRAWLFQRCVEALIELQFKVSEGIETAEESAKAESDALPQRQLEQAAAGCFMDDPEPVKKIDPPEIAPVRLEHISHCKFKKADPSKNPDWRLGLDGPCLQKCRPVALNKLKLTRMEAAAALDIPETSFRRLLAKCKAEKKG